MIKQAFLTRKEIKALQAQEVASTKEQKRTPEQIDAIYSSGTNIPVSYTHLDVYKRQLVHRWT